jgi:hypothetical protein
MWWHRWGWDAVVVSCCLCWDWCCEGWEEQGFLVAPPPKPVVVHRIWCASQILARADADRRECDQWYSGGGNQATGWGGGCEEEEDDDDEDSKKCKSRIRISGDDSIDSKVELEHELYKATGSIEAQARIDSYIMPCIVLQTFGAPYEKGCIVAGNIRDRIPGYLWSEMIRATDIDDVLQYHTLPDLGMYVRERMTAQSVFVPTSSIIPNSSLSSSSSKTKKRKVLNNGNNNNNDMLPLNVLGNVPAFLHMCCPGHSCKGGDQSFKTRIACCASTGCIHGSIISLLVGSVMPICKKASQCRRLHPSHAQVKSAASCCTLMEFTIICALVQALLTGLYPRYAILSLSLSLSFFVSLSLSLSFYHSRFLLHRNRE